MYPKSKKYRKKLRDSDAVNLNIVSTQSRIQERLVPDKLPSVTGETSTHSNAAMPIHSLDNTVKLKLTKFHSGKVQMRCDNV